MTYLSLGTKVAIPTGVVGVITDFSLAVTVEVEGPQGPREFTVDLPTARLWADRYEEQSEPSTEPQSDPSSDGTPRDGLTVVDESATVDLTTMR